MSVVPSPYSVPNILAGDALALAREEARLDALQYAADVAETINVRGTPVQLADGTEVWSIIDERPDEVKEEMLLRTTSAVSGRVALFYLIPEDADKIAKGTFIGYSGEKWNLFPPRDVVSNTIRIMTVHLATTGAIE